MPCPCDSGLPCDQKSCEGAGPAPLTCDVKDCPCGICEPKVTYRKCDCGLIGGKCDCPAQKGYKP